MKHEWRKHEKALYGAGKTPELLDVPAQKFIIISGRGDPNGEDFSARISALYPLAYALRSIFKARDEDYAVYPLEGLWSGSVRGGAVVKAELEYELMIRQPDAATEAEFAEALDKTRRKKPSPLLDEVRFETMTDGRCVQMLHTGSYDGEPASFALMADFAAASGLERAGERHRETYLNNAQRTEPDKLKTILRFPVR